MLEIKTDYSSIAFFSTYALATGIRLYFLNKNKKNNDSLKEVKSLTDKILFSSVFLSLRVLPVTYFFSNVLDRFNYESPKWCLPAGIALGVSSCLLFAKSHYDLGENFSTKIATKEGQTLVTTGVYKHIRHPMYSSMLMFCAAQALLINNSIAGFSGMISFVGFMGARLPKEDKMLQEIFGNDYKEYANKTPALIPRL